MKKIVKALKKDDARVLLKNRCSHSRILDLAPTYMGVLVQYLQYFMFYVFRRLFKLARFVYCTCPSSSMGRNIMVRQAMALPKPLYRIESHTI